ncbi:Sec-independent protein translocase protein TatB [Alphaproteobacteria bacterium]|nr:Sec-independent protein translocase protein TatB [Alphaproteobacteria bacterium]
MLDIGFPEFLLISFVLLIVVGPKDLPKVLRSVTTFIRKIKTMASQFHSGIDDLANESEISDLRKEVSKIENNPILDSEINEIKDFKNEINVKSLKDNVNEIKDSQNNSVKPKKTSKTIKK